MLPPRTADTMSDAIAMSSPSGKMSKRARAAADKLFHEKLFGKHCTKEDFTGVAPQETNMEIAKRLRDIAKLANKSQAKKLITEAEALEAGSS